MVLPICDRGGSHFIKDIQLYEHEPSELSRLAHDSCHQRMYFFTRLSSSHHSEMVYRKAGCGFWNKVGSSSWINDKDGKPLAMKHSLTTRKMWRLNGTWRNTHFCTITSIRFCTAGCQTKKTENRRCYLLRHSVLSTTLIITIIRDSRMEECWQTLSRW